MTPAPDFTPAHAVQLATFLSAPERPEGTMSYCELAGFLFAVACAPELVPPAEWIPLIFDEQEGNFKDLAEAEATLAAMMVLYNHLTQEVLDGQPALPFGCEVYATPLANLEPDAPLSHWARGFVIGHGWLMDMWDEYTPEELDEELGADLMVQGFFAGPDVAEAYRQEVVGDDDKPLAVLAGEILETLPDAMQSYALLGRTIYQVLNGPEDEPSGAVGRNDPCPCGSGKKYKKCCGSSLH